MSEKFTSLYIENLGTHFHAVDSPRVSNVLFTKMLQKCKKLKAKLTSESH